MTGDKTCLEGWEVDFLLVHCSSGDQVQVFLPQHWECVALQIMKWYMQNVKLKSENNLNSLMQLQIILVFPFFQLSSRLYRYDLLHSGQNCTVCILLQLWQPTRLSNQIMFICAVIKLNPMKSMTAFPVALISQI